MSEANQTAVGEATLAQLVSRKICESTSGGRAVLTATGVTIVAHLLEEHDRLEKQRDALLAAAKKAIAALTMPSMNLCDDALVELAEAVAAAESQA